ncbi:MAG: thioredoxin family protein, partial [Cyclobacteriaceae bacterium]|nr:thioredoxin family protein [Cyclobacteriaceae bacterium]
DENWYLYSSDFDPDLGPMVTEFIFEPDDSYELAGDIKPVNPKKSYDEIFEGEYTYFSGKAEFRQTVRALAPDLKIQGSYSYQVCSDIDGKCIPFEDEFTVSDVTVLAGANPESPGQDHKTGQGKTGTATGPGSEDTEDNAEDDAEDATEKISVQPLIPVGEAEIDRDQEEGPAESAENIGEAVPGNREAAKGDQKRTSVLNQRDVNDPYTLLSFMIVAFLGGLAALLTPCVFPMIPMTVTFFTGRAKTRSKGVKNALIYGLSIILIYTIIGSVIAPFMGPEVANVLATHWLPNIIFFLVFLIFALSFFGLFEINLPSSFVNKMDQKADKGGFAGIFFMAFTLVLVSFSCTGPIVGSILVESAGGLVLKPILGMLGFALAFAIPFTLFAIFPEWLNTLPKSGGWLNAVKVVLGFIELAFALKFLSVADQAYHWGLLDREIYLALWIIIFALMGFYILGKIRLPHDSKLERISVGRLILAILTFAFVIYLIPGMFGAPLKKLAGYLPPMSTHDFKILDEIRNTRVTYAGDVRDDLCEPPKYDEFLNFPHGLQGYFDFEQALECAREKNKPLFIDFTGHGCVNCREMEARVWSDPAVLEKLSRNYVMVALYVDDKTRLPEEDWYTSSYDGKVKKTIGKQNADFQINHFNNNAQPFYVLLDHNENLLVEPKAYDLDVNNFLRFLDEGKNNFDEKLSLK